MAEFTLDDRRALERLRYIHPGNVERVLFEPRYWTMQFARFYRLRCREIACEDAASAFDLSKNLVALTERVDVGSASTSFRTPLEKKGAVLVAKAVCGLCACVAEEPLDTLLLTDEAVGPPSLQAELHLLRAYCCASAEDLASARSELGLSLASCWTAGLGDQEVEAHLLAAEIERESQPDVAMESLLTALARSEQLESEQGRKLTHLALNGLTSLLRLRAPGLADQDKAVRALERLIASWKGRRHQKAKAKWAQGVALANLKIDRQATRLLERAAKFLLQAEISDEHELVMLDLVWAHLATGSPEEAGAAMRQLRHSGDLEMSLEGLDHARERLDSSRRLTLPNLPVLSA